MKKLINTYVLGIIVSLFSITTYAVEVPNTFSANTPAVAADVNANFTALKNGINGVIASINSSIFLFNQRTITDITGVGVATCATGEVVVGASCRCTGSNTAGQNFGVLFGCNVAGNGVVGACFDFLFDPSLVASPVEVKAVCAQSSVGTPLPLTTTTILSEPDQEAIDAADVLRATQLEMREVLINQ